MILFCENCDIKFFFSLFSHPNMHPANYIYANLPGQGENVQFVGYAVGPNLTHPVQLNSPQYASEVPQPCENERFAHILNPNYVKPCHKRETTDNNAQPPSNASYSQTSPLPKPLKMAYPKFDGNSSLELFKVEFTDVANNYHLEGVNRRSQLIQCLQGRARQAIGCLPKPELLTEAIIWRELEARYKRRDDFTTLQQELSSRKQRNNESYEELAQSILNIIRRMDTTNPSAELSQLQASMALSSFIDSIKDDYVRLWTQNRGPRSLSEAIEIANQMKLAKSKNVSKQSSEIKSLRDEVMAEVRRIKDDHEDHLDYLYGCMDEFSTTEPSPSVRFAGRGRGNYRSRRGNQNKKPSNNPPKSEGPKPDNENSLNPQGPTQGDGKGPL